MGTVRQTGVEGVHVVKSTRPGKPTRWYIYAWRGGPALGPAIEQRERPTLTPAHIEKLSHAQAEQSAPKATVKGLSAQWIRSRQWKDYAQSTRDEWSRLLIRIERKWGDVPLRVFGDPRMTPKLVKWRDQLAEDHGKRNADETIKVLSLLLQWGVLRGEVASNTAGPIPRLWKGGNREEIIWTAEDCAAFDAVAPQYLVDARRLAEFTGLRRADLVALTWSGIADTHVALTAKKKSCGKRRRVIMPIVPGLRELLEELKTRPRKAGVETVLAGAKGGSLSPHTLSIEFSKYRDKANAGAGIVHPAEFDDEQDRAKHLHDLRGTYATKLMTLPGGGLTDAQIATVMGWTEKQVAAIRKRYVDEAAIVVAIGKRIAEAM